MKLHWTVSLSPEEGDNYPAGLPLPSGWGTSPDEALADLRRKSDDTISSMQQAVSAATTALEA